MSLSEDLVTKERIVKLAAMECFASCILTYVNMSGRDPNYFLLDYWNINYQYRTLLSSKDTRQMLLKQLYGIEMDFVKGNEEDLRRHILNGSCAILLCTASRLPYFPASMLGMESTGFQHSVLIIGGNEAADQWVVVDPMVGFLGEVPVKILAAAGQRNDRREELLYYLLENSPARRDREPSKVSLFALCAERNLSSFINERTAPGVRKSEFKRGTLSKQADWLAWFSNRHGGVRALERFASDTVASEKWSMPVRNGWIDRNLLTISSILLIRTQVWDCYCRLNIMNSEQVKEGKERLQCILKDWRNLSIKLLKYKITSNINKELVPGLLRNIELIRIDESHFLEWLAAAGENALKEIGSEKGRFM